MYLCKIENTHDHSTAFLSTPYHYAHNDIVYPHPDYHPQLAGHESNRWRVLACVEDNDELRRRFEQ